MLVFGLQWLRKAILRAGGYKALHDEAAIFQREVDAARDAPRVRRGVVEDWYSFTLSFKGVVLEGLEVVFIALTFGSNQHDVPLAAVAAGAAVLLVAGLGRRVRAPLARVPENTMKFVVGVMLTGFGTFWGAEGAGAVWPGSDAALLVLVPAIAVLAIALVACCFAGGPPTHPAGRSCSGGRGVIARLRAFGAFWYDFVVGDDWRVAVGVVIALAGDIRGEPNRRSRRGGSCRSRSPSCCPTASTELCGTAATRPIRWRARRSDRPRVRVGEPRVEQGRVHDGDVAFGDRRGCTADTHRGDRSVPDATPTMFVVEGESDNRGEPLVVADVRGEMAEGVRRRPSPRVRWLRRLGSR